MHIRYFLKRFARLAYILILIRLSIMIMFDIERSIYNVFYNEMMLMGIFLVAVFSFYTTYRHKD